MGSSPSCGNLIKTISDETFPSDLRGIFFWRKISNFNEVQHTTNNLQDNNIFG